MKRYKHLRLALGAVFFLSVYVPSCTTAVETPESALESLVPETEGQAGESAQQTPLPTEPSLPEWKTEHLLSPSE